MNSSQGAKISIIMSVYNGKEYLMEAIGSVLSQTLRDFEFIIIDDNSTDGSSDVLKAAAEKDPRIRLIKNEHNLGLTKSLNLAAKVAVGEYIVRMDADDVCLPDRLECQFKYMLEHESVDLVYTDTLLIDKNTSPICASWRPKTVKKVLDCLEVHNFIPHPTVMLKKSTFDRLDGYDERYRTGQDVNLWVRMKHDGCLFGYIDKVLLKYRLNPTSVRRYLNDYWFMVANYCIWNGEKYRALHYFRYLSARQKIIIGIKMLFPFFYFVGRYK